MRLARLLVTCVLVAGCAAPDEAATCRPLALDLHATEARVGEDIEMQVSVANCGDSSMGYLGGCIPPAPSVEVDGVTYWLGYGAATDETPECGSAPGQEVVTLAPRQAASRMVKWNGTVSSGCTDGCGPPAPAPGVHVLRIQFQGHAVERSVEFR